MYINFVTTLLLRVYNHCHHKAVQHSSTPYNSSIHRKYLIEAVLRYADLGL